MARIRSIKPEFWTDEKVVALSPLARLLFIGTWNFVDDEGRGEFSPTRLKMQILPADSADISELLGEIRREELIQVYAIDGKQYFVVKNFGKHQKIDKRSKSKLPKPPSLAETRRLPTTDQGGDQGKELPSSSDDGRISNHPPSASPPQAEDLLTEEPEVPGELGEFWAAAKRLERRGLVKSRCGQLLKVMSVSEGLDALKSTERSREPSKYLGKILSERRKEVAVATGPPAANGSVPPWVAERRRDGDEIAKEGTMWRWGEGLYNDQGDQVGY